MEIPCCPHAAEIESGGGQCPHAVPCPVCGAVAGEWCRPYFNEEQGFWENTKTTPACHFGRHKAASGLDTLKVRVVRPG